MIWSLNQNCGEAGVCHCKNLHSLGPVFATSQFQALDLCIKFTATVRRRLYD
jgi:hypothetical protein